MATVSDYQNLHGKSIIDEATAALGSTLMTLLADRAWATYGLSSADALTASEDVKEMVALTSLINAVGSYVEQVHATSGAVQKIKMGGDGTPEITFFDRAQTMLSYRRSLTGKLSDLQRKCGYVPYLDPKSGDIPFVLSRVDMETDEVTDGVYDEDANGHDSI